MFGIKSSPMMYNCVTIHLHHFGLAWCLCPFCSPCILVWEWRANCMDAPGMFRLRQVFKTTLMMYVWNIRSVLLMPQLCNVPGTSLKWWNPVMSAHAWLSVCHLSFESAHAWVPRERGWYATNMRTYFSNKLSETQFIKLVSWSG